VRKVRGPILDKLYAELKRCGDLSCTGRSFIEHRNVPVLTVNRRDSRPAWQQGCGEPDISYVRGGQRVRKDTKTHQDRWLAIDPATCALIANYLDEIRTQLAAVGAELRDDAYLFSNDPSHARPWNPDWVTHQIAAAAEAAGVDLDIKGGRRYTAASFSPAASICATPPPGSATAAAARPPFGITLIRSPRSTGGPPPTSPS
jgi:hypothetical protein